MYNLNMNGNMEKYIAILRGINVSGSKMIKMDSLKLSMMELNFKKIETYIQSGNLIFEYAKTNQHNLADLIKHKIQESFGFQIPVIVKNAEEMNVVITNNPFVNIHKEAIDKLHVTFLSAEPVNALKYTLTGIKSDSDEFYIDRNVVYLFCPNGYGRTKLTNNYFETKLKIAATTRNWKTVIKVTGIVNAK